MDMKLPRSNQLTGRRRLFLMRHGHVDYFDRGITDPRMVDLTQEGRAQAQAASDMLAHITFDMAMCSGLPRTVQTAEIVLSAHATAPALSQDLRFEEIKSGWLQAGSREELAARLAYCFDSAGDADARFLPDGETFGEVEARVINGLIDLLTTRHWQTGLLVAHEGVNRVLLGCCTGGGLATIRAFEQDLCAVNVIDFDITPAIAEEGIESDASHKSTNSQDRPYLFGAERNEVRVERAILKQMNVTPYDIAKKDLRRTSLEHIFGVDFGGARPLQKFPMT